MPAATAPQVATYTNFIGGEWHDSKSSAFEIRIAELTERIAAATGFAGSVIWDTSKPNGQPRRTDRRPQPAPPSFPPVLGSAARGA